MLMCRSTFVNLKRANIKTASIFCPNSYLSNKIRMCGLVNTWKSWTLLKFGFLGCLGLSKFWLNFSKEISKFMTWCCWPCLYSKILELLYSHIHIRLSLLSTISITFENKAHTRNLRPIIIAHNLYWFNGKIIIDFNRNIVW